MLNVRKLAAVDLYFLGSKFILAEFGLGMAGLGALGWFTLRAGIRREHGAWLIAWGLYMLGLGINYVPLFLHAISIARRASAREEIADELKDRRGAARKYQRQSLVITNDRSRVVHDAGMAAEAGSVFASVVMKELADARLGCDK